jgi:hypothetical protein
MRKGLVATIRITDAVGNKKARLKNRAGTFNH